MKRFFLSIALVLAFGFAIATLGSLNLAAAAKGESLVVPHEVVWAASIFWLISAMVIPTVAIHRAK